MKILVTYYSKTGNTKKVAEAIWEAIPDTGKEIFPLDQVKNPDPFDLIFCGFPIINHSIPSQAGLFLKNLPRGKKMAFFSTHGSYRGGEKAISGMYAALSLSSGQIILGSFGCRGQVDPKVLEKLIKEITHHSWAKEAESACSHPDASDLQDARDFAQVMLYSAINNYR